MGNLLPLCHPKVLAELQRQKMLQKSTTLGLLISISSEIFIQ